jgi:hypothetical protein
MNPSQLRGQPRLEPRSLLSFDLGRRTSKVQGYAVRGSGSTLIDTRTGALAVGGLKQFQILLTERSGNAIAAFDTYE